MFTLFGKRRRKKRIPIGAVVEVSAEGGWRVDCEAKARSGPEPVETRQGEDYFYWVDFDVPQHDLSDDGPYESAQILSRYLRKNS